MVDKKIIEKVFNQIFFKEISIKCSKSDLTKADKEFINNFINSDEHWRDDAVDGKENTAYSEYEELQLKHEYRKDEKEAVHDWKCDGFKIINGKIYNTEYYNLAVKAGLVFEKTLNKKINNLQSAIDNSPRVPFNLVTHRKGHWDKNHKPGDVIVLKGFASTSLTGGIQVGSTDPYDIDYFVPVDNKAILVTPKQFYGLPEKELLLGKGTRQYVLSQDDDNKKVSILVLPDK